MSRCQARASDHIGEIPSVTGEDHDITEAVRAGGSKADHHQAGLPGRQAEVRAGLASAAAFDGERKSCGDCARQGWPTEVNHLETLRADLANDYWAEVQIGWTSLQLRRQIGYGNVIGLNQSADTHRPADGEADGACGRQGVGVAQIGGESIGSSPVAKVPEAVGNGAGGAVAEIDRQWQEAAGRGGAEVGCCHQRPRAQDGIGGEGQARLWLAVVHREDDHVTETDGVNRREADDEVGGTEASQTEGCAGHDAEGSLTDCRNAACHCPAQVGNHKAGCGAAAHRNRAEVEARWQHGWQIRRHC